ncbi:MAG: cell division protein SepF [Candidatus Bathyarchaeia archaeon]
MPGLGGILRKSKREEKAELKGASGKTYLKAMPLRDLSDLDNVKAEVKSGNILILRITPLASKSVDDVKRAVNELCEFAESLGGDIARLGEERVVICPPNVKIWREKTPVSKEPMVTAA